MKQKRREEKREYERERGRKRGREREKQKLERFKRKYFAKIDCVQVAEAPLAEDGATC